MSDIEEVFHKLVGSKEQFYSILFCKTILWGAGECNLVRNKFEILHVIHHFWPLMSNVDFLFRIDEGVGL